MNRGLKLRKFSPPDLDRILEIEKSSFSSTDAYSKKRFENLYKRHSDDFIVVKKAERVLGYVIGYDGGGFVDLDSMAVDRAYRNLGIGSMLVNAVLDRFKKAGLKKASLEVRAANKATVSFYKKLGFKIVETLNKYYRDGQDAHRMEKAL